MRHAFLLCILTLCQGVAMANDSSATLGAGGIVLSKSAGITLQQEDLLISVARVSVSYRFKNVTSSDIRTRIAFPLPEWDEEDGDVDLDGSSQNPMRFSVTVDGRPRPFETEVRRRGRIVKVTHHWMQVFAADQSVSIQHEYKPVAGSFFTGYLDPRAFDDISLARTARALAKQYCVGTHLLRWLLKEERIARPVHYVLRTAGNWKGPIGHFKLTIRKSNPGDRVSMCFAGPLRKETPTTFVFEQDDFRPTADLAILFIPVEPWSPN